MCFTLVVEFIGEVHHARRRLVGSGHARTCYDHRAIPRHLQAVGHLHAGHAAQAEALRKVPQLDGAILAAADGQRGVHRAAGDGRDAVGMACQRVTTLTWRQEDMRTLATQIGIHAWSA